MERRYKFILIDADGTIMDFEKTEMNALQKTVDYLKYAERELFVASFLDINTQVWKELEQGKVKADQVNELRFTRLFKALKEKAPREISPKETGEYFIKQLCRGGYTLLGAREMIEYLAGKYTLILATNGLAKVQRARMKESGLGSFFHSLAISQELGFHKPQAEYFEEALKDYDYEKSQCLMIGDSLFSDMAGADAFGIDSIWFNEKEILNDNIASPTYEIDRLDQIRTLL